MISPEQMTQALALVIEEAPGSLLCKNQVGNLAILRDGKYVGYVDLADGEVALFEDEGQSRTFSTSAL